MNQTKSTEIQVIPKELQIIQDKIYEIRGYRVMLDFDIAELYGTETKRLKEQVRRNIERFPDDFMFEITREEYNSLRSQIASLEIGRGKCSKYLPFAFTEQGVTMLSSVLNSKPAITTNIKIMRAFVAVRQLVLNPPVNETKELQNEVRELKQYIEDVFTDYNDINEDTRMQLELINETLAELQNKNRELNKPRRPIGYQYCHAAQE
ncbi:MAG: ORF6N domain-containing protein [Dysgonamonadaceae bacterium]|jgi:hypothetical protein|nr:ORF6N domain-containing protein [Dysgonamonadaceae bacterium]